MDDWRNQYNTPYENWKYIKKPKPNISKNLVECPKCLGTGIQYIDVDMDELDEMCCDLCDAKRKVDKEVALRYEAEQ